MTTEFSKFILGENPLINDGRVFVIHLQKPVIIAQAFHFEGCTGDEPELMNCKKQFETGASVDYPGEQVVLGAVYVAPNELSANRLAGIMSRMGDWYYSYLKFEDENIRKEFLKCLKN
jgi:hypothetical protein